MMKREEILELVKDFKVIKGYDDSNEVYSDYRDEFEESTIKDILQDKHPMDKFNEVIDEGYQYCIFEYEDELKREFLRYLEDDKEIDLEEEDEDFISEVLREEISFCAPSDRFLNQEVDTIIVLDAEDSYSFAPAYAGKEIVSEDDLSDKSSLVYLSMMQGYSKKDFLETFRRMYESDEKIDYHKSYPFLESVYIELLNTSSECNSVTIFQKRTLRELIEWKEKLDSIQNEKDANKSNDFSIHIDKSDRCGLVDFFVGGGSILDITLEKDMDIPASKIFFAGADACMRYSSASIYGEFPI